MESREAGNRSLKGGRTAERPNKRGDEDRRAATWLNNRGPPTTAPPTFTPTRRAQATTKHRSEYQAQIITLRGTSGLVSSLFTAMMWKISLLLFCRYLVHLYCLTCSLNYRTSAGSWVLCPGEGIVTLMIFCLQWIKWKLDCWWVAIRCSPLPVLPASLIAPHAQVADY